MTRTIIKDLRKYLKKNKVNKQKEIKNNKQEKITKMQKGGKYLAEGSYGCVFRPSLECAEPKLDRDQNKITKLMLGEYALDEKNKLDIVKQFDPDYKYHIGIEDFCENPTFLKEMDIREMEKDQLNHCEILMKKLEKPSKLNFTLINYKYGGRDLIDYLIDKEDEVKKLIIRTETESKKENYEKLSNHVLNLERDFFKFFIGMENLFEGLDVFYDNDFLHCDIKGGNIVIDTSNPAKYVFKFIDFGLSNKIKQNEMEQNDKYKFIKLGQHQSIPDFIFIDGNNYLSLQFEPEDQYKKKFDYEKIIYSLNKSNKKEQLIKKFSNVKINANSNIQGADFFDKLYIFIGYYLNNLKFATNELQEDELLRIIKMMDIFCLGIVLVDAFNTHFIFGNLIKNNESKFTLPDYDIEPEPEYIYPLTKQHDNYLKINFNVHFKNIPQLNIAEDIINSKENAQEQGGEQSVNDKANIDDYTSNKKELVKEIYLFICGLILPSHKIRTKPKDALKQFRRIKQKIIEKNLV